MKALKYFAGVVLAVVIVVALVCVLIVNTKSSQQAKARNIKLGDSKAEVEQRLGKATAVTHLSALWRSNAMAALFCDTTETWAYGNRLDFKSKFPWIRLRLFLPNPDDIAVEFDISNQVVRVTIP